MNLFYVSLENVKNTLMNVLLNQSLISLSVTLDCFKKILSILAVQVIYLINVMMVLVELKLIIVLFIKDVIIQILLIDVYPESVQRMLMHVKYLMLT